MARRHGHGHPDCAHGAPVPSQLLQIKATVSRAAPGPSLQLSGLACTSPCSNTSQAFTSSLFLPPGAPHLLQHRGGTTPASGPSTSTTGGLWHQTPGFKPQPCHSQMCDQPSQFLSFPTCKQVVIQ